MTPEAIAERWLSLRCWLQRSVLPAAVLTIVFVVGLQQIEGSARSVNHAAVLIGFGALYFVLFRGGHILMIRSLHADMMKRHEEAYRGKLAALKEDDLKRANLGFTLARVKRDILVDVQKKPDLGLKK